MPAALILLILFLATPLIEIAVFIEVGGYLGLWPTLGLVIFTAVVGVALLRAQGLAVLLEARQRLDRGELPVKALFDGACLLLAGALLLTPGFVTDALGGSLLVPGVRDMLRRHLGRHLVVQAAMADGPGNAPGAQRPEGTIIEGEYREVGDDEDKG